MFGFIVPWLLDSFSILSSTPSLTSIGSRVLNDNSMQALGFLLLDIDCLDVAVQFLLGALLVVSLSADAHAQSEWDAFDAALPNLLVQLRVEADVAGPLSGRERHVSE